MDPVKIEQIKEHLRGFWFEQSILVNVDSTSIDELVSAMDSKTAVEALIEVEDIVDMELPVGEVVRQGGYNSHDEFVEELTRSIIKYVEEKSS